MSAQITPPRRSRASTFAMAAASLFLAVACLTTPDAEINAVHDWWAARGPVVPHDSFPTDCELCHVGDKWNELTDDFTFNHEKETGVPLNGAHGAAQCLRCHNDRGPVDVFTARGCAGCHEDVHAGRLSNECASCHQENTWRPFGQVERHANTRFPLTGIHAATACRRCHISAEVGKFLPVDTECVTCHRQDLQRAQNPNHILLGWRRQCDKCHLATSWNQAEVDPNF